MCGLLPLSCAVTWNINESQRRISRLYMNSASRLLEIYSNFSCECAIKSVRFHSLLLTCSGLYKQRKLVEIKHILTVNLPPYNACLRPLFEALGINLTSVCDCHWAFLTCRHGLVNSSLKASWSGLGKDLYLSLLLLKKWKRILTKLSLGGSYKKEFQQVSKSFSRRKTFLLKG